MNLLSSIVVYAAFGWRRHEQGPSEEILREADVLVVAIGEGAEDYHLGSVYVCVYVCVSLYIYIYMYMYTCVCMYIYIYIMCVYIYIYIHTYTCVYI